MLSLLDNTLIDLSESMQACLKDLALHRYKLQKFARICIYSMYIAANAILIS